MMTALTVDFSSLDSSLLTGRENGKRARDKFKIKEALDGYILKSNEEQLVTSSYLLGLLGIEFKKYATANEALERINMDGLSEKSRRECERAIRRGLSRDRDIF